MCRRHKLVHRRVERVKLERSLALDGEQASEDHVDDAAMAEQGDRFAFSCRHETINGFANPQEERGPTVAASAM